MTDTTTLPAPAQRPLVVALAGFLPGVLLNAGPPLLVLLYLRSVTATARPDSGFNLLTLGAGALLLVDAGLLIAALVALFRPAARACAAGYLAGVFAVLVTLVALAPFVG
ncbi:MULTISPECIES: hypothetical protein [Micromonospora]|uniref:Uncharacterized protein n=1 Tax=Micromonospora solifontis TaxID=2487138 RepID=A0ABX9W8J5_9ACTN|nr:MULTISPECIES: hypothetical protein [Micromonospora]NES13382.1 hypothetical protein [Micromonospora sp. PPF5-17B]NES39647.1 hypothetical protein [Micromonospora solifontis]NES55602.1 hypothetical protein [Micromonospora sp. PPF5-6]RNL87781.1 hypothetical protein EFE23_26575 [Micromonospora solifontis]